MVEKLTSRIPIGFTESEKKHYEELATRKKFPSLAALVRAALDFYERKSEESTPATTDIDSALAAQKREFASILEQINEKIEKFSSLPPEPIDENVAQKKKILTAIITSHPEGISFGNLVEQTGWSRKLVTKICLILASDEERAIRKNKNGDWVTC